MHSCPKAPCVDETCCLIAASIGIEVFPGWTLNWKSQNSDFVPVEVVFPPCSRLFGHQLRSPNRTLSNGTRAILPDACSTRRSRVDSLLSTSLFGMARTFDLGAKSIPVWPVSPDCEQRCPRCTARSGSGTLPLPLGDLLLQRDGEPFKRSLYVAFLCTIRCSSLCFLD